MKSKLIIFLFLVVSVFITMNRGAWKENNVIIWDGTGYYMYLPATIIGHDPGNLQFYSRIDSLYKPSGGVLQYGIHFHEATGKKSTRYPVGVALFELPGFLIAHGYTTCWKYYPPDGYSAPYQLAVALGTIFWAVLGLIFLRRFLLRFFPEATVWLCMLLIAFGTNLYYYTAFFQSWSHPYSFFLMCFILYLTERWYATGKAGFIVLLGFAIGLTIITRPTNVLVALIPLLWQLNSWGAIKARFSFLAAEAGSVIVACLLFVAVLMIQLSYWKYTTGHWVYYSYENEGFDFLHPKIWKGLFSYRKGWFIYTPLAFLFLLGLAPLYRYYRSLFLPVVLYVILQVYIVFSWKIWHYGGCFSCRPMVEALAVLSIPACALIGFIQERAKTMLTLAASSIALLLVALNLFQSYQFSLGIIHFDRMTSAYYWRSFGKLKVTDEDRKLLRYGTDEEAHN